MASCAWPLTDGVDLIEEDDASLLASRHREELPHHTRSLPDVSVKKGTMKDKTDVGVYVIVCVGSSECIYVWSH